MTTTTSNNQVAVQQKNITEQVMDKVKVFQHSGELRLPKDYSPENAIKAAYLTLQEVRSKDGKPALEVCKPATIANALLKMVVWGLSPLKKQCDFIVRGDTLCCDPEYTGNIALAVRYGGLKSHKGNAIFQGDDFKFEVGIDGRRKLIHHKQDLASIGGDVIGAYVTYELEDGTQDMEIMNMNQIRNSWLQGAAKGGSMAHKNFTDQMAIKTVYNRMTKLLIRASNDAPLMGDAGSDDNEQKPYIVSEAKQEVIAKANAEEISFEDVPAEQPKAETTQTSADPEPVKQETSQTQQSTSTQAEIPY